MSKIDDIKNYLLRLRHEGFASVGMIPGAQVAAESLVTVVEEQGRRIAVLEARDGI